MKNKLTVLMSFLTLIGMSNAFASDRCIDQVRNSLLITTGEFSHVRFDKNGEACPLYQVAGSEGDARFVMLPAIAGQDVTANCAGDGRAEDFMFSGLKFERGDQTCNTYIDVFDSHHYIAVSE